MRARELRHHIEHALASALAMAALIGSSACATPGARDARDERDTQDARDARGTQEPPTAPQAPSPEQRGLATAAFARLKSLQGEWIGRSTKGWEERMRYDTIAGGSAVVETSTDAHPGERMLTTFVLDGGRLLLTHYCIAGNQPRLAATGFEDEGRVVRFTFLDATGLPSRDTGHMDSCLLRFVDADHLTSQWTWFQGGEASWMEEIVCERVR